MWHCHGVQWYTNVVLWYTNVVQWYTNVVEWYTNVVQWYTNSQQRVRTYFDSNKSVTNWKNLSAKYSEIFV